MKHRAGGEFGEAETREFNPYGFCVCCGLPMHKPRKWGGVFFCADCIIRRTEDCQNIVKAMSVL